MRNSKTKIDHTINKRGCRLGSIPTNLTQSITVSLIFKVWWSLYVPHSGYCMYRTVVTICTAQWSLYVPHGGHYMYRTVVTICATSFILKVLHCPTHRVYLHLCSMLTTNSYYFAIQHKPIGLCNGDCYCFCRGANSVVKCLYHDLGASSRQYVVT